MKKIKHINLILVGLFVLLITNGFAQTSTTSQPIRQRCGTTEAFEFHLANDSAFREDYYQKTNNLGIYATNNQKVGGNSGASSALSGPVLIPVVVHILLPNPYMITDADVDYFIQRLNLDFSGFNPDSTNGSSFYSVRGHSLLRFALAKRDVNGNPTTGIERKVCTATITQTTQQSIKSTTTGGLNPWDITKYYNLYVGDPGTSGLLGISPQIGPGTQSGSDRDGVCVAYNGFAHNPCYVDAVYNLSRTAVHEIGHNFGLCHTFASGCTGLDFTQLTSPGKSLPSSLLASSDDTPPIKVSTSDCPSQGTGNGCTPSVPKMFQNFMDYTQDACYSMFTKAQVDRMHYVLEHFRSGYLTTQGYLPPSGTPHADAASTTIVSPNGTEMNGCNAVSYPAPTCGTGAFIPKLNVTSFGIDTLTSVGVGLMLNGNVLTTKVFNVNLGYGKSQVLSLPSQNLVTGTNVLKYYTFSPNGVQDSLKSNDTLTLTINFNTGLPTPATLPLVEGFENAAFDPTSTGWTVVNQRTGSITWARTTNAAKTGTASAMINLFSYTTKVGDSDYLKSPLVNFGSTYDSAFVSFNYAYRLKSNSSASKRDTLSVEVSTDCGASWNQVWKKGGANLPTNNTIITTNWNAASSDWTSNPIVVPLNSYMNAPIYIAFRSKNGDGQNLFLDDINIYGTNILPLKLLSFNLQQNGTSVLCKWETADEQNVSHFEIERSFNGVSFETVGQVKAGNTGAVAYYNFVDENALKQLGNKLYYRIKMIDNNGKYNYSKINTITIGETQSVQIFPNPVQNELTLQLNNTANRKINNTIQIVDILGRIVEERKAIFENGTNSFYFNTANLKSGNYILFIKGDENKTFKFTKQ